MESIDHAVLNAILSDVLSTFASETVAEARRRFEASARPDERQRLTRALTIVDREIERLSEAIALGADKVAAIMARMNAPQTKQRALRAELQEAGSCGTVLGRDAALREGQPEGMGSAAQGWCR
jgi:hypothetical protein